jgi:RNA polymerase sigma-70 factor, ECF subfamily
VKTTGEEAAIDSKEGRHRRAEFERVAIVHSSGLLRTALRLSPDTETAEDLVQETLLRAWKAFDQFEAGTNCKAWLFRIMLNLLGRERKSNRNNPPIASLDEQPEWNQLAVPHEDPLKHADLRTALAALPEEHRVVLLLAVVEGFTCKEIAAVLSIPIGTVMSRLSRARLGLRTKLSHPGQASESAREAFQRGVEGRIQ